MSFPQVPSLLKLFTKYENLQMEYSLCKFQDSLGRYFFGLIDKLGDKEFDNVGTLDKTFRKWQNVLITRLHVGTLL